jgi:glutathione S-transferase
MFESDQILEYLFKTYGNGQVPWTLSPPNSPWVALTAGLGLFSRGGRGSTRKPTNPPSTPLELWSYEGSPFCKLVREVLCELEIPHTQISCPRGSPNRQRMLDELGRFQVPHVRDPNTGVALWESRVIIEYLEKQYGVAPSPVKYI